MTGEEKASGKSGPSNLVIALVAALVAALVVIGWQAIDGRGGSDDSSDAQSDTASGQEALEVAKALLLEITSYSWKDGEHDFAWVDQLESKELKSRLAPNVPDLQKRIVEGKVTAKGKVIDAMYRVVEKTQVEVMAFVDQAIADETSKDVKIEEQRVSMTLKLVDGQWVTSRLDLLSGTNSPAAE